MFVVYKPHVAGPEGAITTPDIIIDHVFVDGTPIPARHVTTDGWLQVADGTSSRVAYAIMALGGGAILAPALVLSCGAICVARRAWRLHDLDDRIGDVTLNGTALASIGLPADLIAHANGEGDALPRGYLLIRTSKVKSWQATLHDETRNRTLEHRVHGMPVSEDRWGEGRPRPRYSVGPTQKDVTHYI